jgi:pimeloyl-ACP methyl ester carboxylesterase
MNKSNGIIFISGAGLRPSIWDKVIEGVYVPNVVVDYKEMLTKNPNATLSDYVQIAYEKSVSLNTDTVTVVAHSIGGITGLELVKRLDMKCVGIIGVCAALPKPGNNFMSILPFPQKIVMSFVLKILGTNPPESQIKAGLANGLSDTQTKEIVKQFQPESKLLYTDKTSRAPLPLVPITYIKAMQDKEFSESMYKKILGNYTSADVINVDSGHMPMISHPDEVIRAINASGKRAF